MANITLSVPNDVYRKMKKYKEIKWSEIARKAIMEYLEQLEESDRRTTKELLDELGEDFRSSLQKLSLEDAVEGYEKTRDAEWKRTSTIPPS